MSNNLSGAPVLWQSSMPVELSTIKGDSITTLEVPAIIKVNPDADMYADIHVLWGDKNKTEVTIKAWETLTSNILVSKIFDTGTIGIDDADIKCYK